MPTRRLNYRNRDELRRLLLQQDPAEHVAKMTDLEIQLNPDLGPEIPWLRQDGARVFAARDADTPLPRMTVQDLLDALPA